MNRRLSREESKLITRRRLLEAGSRLLGEQGYGALSASQVARAAGVAQPTFYVHFESKDDLVLTLARETLSELRAALSEARRRAASGRDPDALRDTFRIPLETLIAHPELFRLYIQESHQPSSPFAEHARELSRELVDDLVEDLIAAGAPCGTRASADRLRLAAEGMITLTQSFGLAYLDGRYTDLDQIVDTLTSFALGALGGLATHGARA